jgi:DNA polymerase I
LKTALIDADTLIYEASLAAEKPIEWASEMWTLHASMDEARFTFDKLVDDIKEKTEAERLILALSDSDSAARWRNKIMPTYKQNRKRVRRPVVYVPLRAYCHSHYETFERPGLEGDDVLGIMLTHPTIVRGEKVCVSLDKDLLGIKGKHFNYSTGEFRTVTEAEADYWHLRQALTGDAVDGYSGCPKIGPVSAARILDPFVHEGGFDVQGAWQAIVKVYAKAGLSEDVALANARVARILRAEDWDFDAKRVRLWTP